MSVTPEGSPESRNGSPLHEALVALVALDPQWWCSRWGGTRSCESRNGSPHCPICHLPAHAACHECGVTFQSGRYGSRAVTRVDRCFCSNACRQAAYRRRRKDV